MYTCVSVSDGFKHVLAMKLIVTTTNLALVSMLTGRFVVTIGGAANSRLEGMAASS